MKCKRKEILAEAFCLDRDVEITAPTWFQKEIDKGNIFIDRCITDGTVQIYGCTIHTNYGNVKAKVGDYIIRESSGIIMPCKKKQFKELYERV